MARIGIAVWNFEGDRLSPKLRMFAEMGYTAASINGRLLDTLSDDDLAEAGQVMDEYDLAVTLHGGLRDAEGEAAIGRAERIIKWHERTGRIVCASYDVPRVDIAEGVRRVDPQQVLGRVGEVLSAFEGSGIRVALEDCPTEPAHMEALKGLEGLGVLVDLGHMNLQLREPKHDPQPLKPGAVEAYLKGIPWEIVEVHVHSNDGSRDQHAPPYAPNADLPAAAKVLRETGFDGIHTIEFAPSWCGMPPEEVIPACRKSLEYWSGLL